MIPHERSFEVIVVSVSVNGFQGVHFQQKSRQGVQQVVIKQQRPQLRAKGKRVWNRRILQSGIGQENH